MSDIKRIAKLGWHQIGTYAERVHREVHRESRYTEKVHKQRGYTQQH